MHRDVLELVAVRQHQISMELEAALLEASKNSDDLFSRKKLNISHIDFPLSVSSLGWIRILQLKHIKRCRIHAKAVAHPFVDKVLKDVEVKVD